MTQPVSIYKGKAIKHKISAHVLNRNLNCNFLTVQGAAAAAILEIVT